MPQIHDLRIVSRNIMKILWEASHSGYFITTVHSATLFLAWTFQVWLVTCEPTRIGKGKMIYFTEKRNDGVYPAE